MKWVFSAFVVLWNPRAIEGPVSGDLWPNDVFTKITPGKSRRADPESALPLAESRGIRFNAQPVVHGVSESLLAPEVTLGRLNRNVPKEELDLVQFTAGQMTQPGTRAPQIVRCQYCGRGVVTLFEVDSVAEYDRAVKGEARLRAIPGDELPDGMVVRALAAGRGQAVEDGCLRLFEVW
jgi:hypothetical protein